MAGPRADKVAVVEEVKGRLEASGGAILTEYRGLKVGDLAGLRRALNGAGAEFKIYKNTLVRRATAETGTTVLDPLLEGPTAIAFVAGDVAAVAKVLRDFARTNPALVVKGSLVSGSLVDAPSTARLADLPPREVLLAQIAGTFAAPMQRFAALVKALPQNLAYGLSALLDKRRESEGEEAPAPTEAAGTIADADADADAEADGAGGEASPAAGEQAAVAPEQAETVTEVATGDGEDTEATGATADGPVTGPEETETTSETPSE